MKGALTVTWVAGLLAFLTLAAPLAVLLLDLGGAGFWAVVPFLGLHVATLWQLATPQGRPLGSRLARVTGWLGCAVALALFVIATPAVEGHASASRLGPILFGPALVAHLALALAAGRLHAEAGGGRALRGSRLALYGAGLAAALLIVWVAVPTLDGLDRRHPGRAIGDIRHVISAQMAYASVNQGFYDTLACLESPADCLPGYAESAPVFLESDIMTTQGGYRRRFYPGPPAEVEGEVINKVSPSSIRSFAFVAVPHEPRKTAERAFCGDSSGRLRVSVDGTMPAIRDGHCPQSLPFLE